MKQVEVGSIMHSHIIGVAKSTKLAVAIRLMESSAVSLLPVTYGGKLIGVLTKKDVEKAKAKKYDLDATSVEKAIKEDFEFATVSMDIDQAAKVMIKKGLSRLPVVNNTQDMLCVGTISSTEILHAKNKKKA